VFDLEISKKNKKISKVWIVNSGNSEDVGKDKRIALRRLHCYYQFLTG
jgi:hypothetical protein